MAGMDKINKNKETKMSNLYLDINVLQSVPSSNINRDDTGAPKTAIYGGVTRSRVSSQSWKRAVRTAFKEETDNAEWLEGYRTLDAPKMIAKKMMDLDSELSLENATKKALEIFKDAKIKTDKDNQTKALLLISKGQIDKLVKYALDNEKMDAKEVKKALSGNNSLDLALFGRMVADDPSLNVDAACQVAHAVSTHEVVPEYDYFTAIDDQKPEDTAGSAMLGTIEYNSSTLYRYANVNVKGLINNLGSKDLAIKGIELFVKDFLMTMPTGKENTFANKTIPQYAMITLREDTPVNLVSAFEEPVRSRDGYVQKSIDRLEEEYKDTQKFVEKPIATFILTNKDSELEDKVDNISDLISQVSENVSAKVDDE